MKITLNDGTILDGSVGYAEGFLWCYLTGYTMAEAATMFLDPQKTEKIVFTYGADEDTYEWFTNCTRLMIDVDGKVSVCLTRGAQNG